MRNVFLLLLIIAVVCSCKKENVNVESHIINQKDIFEQVGELISMNLKDPEFSDLIVSTTFRVGIEEFLLSELNSSEIQSRNLNLQSAIDSLVLNNPMLTISFPSWGFYDETLNDHINQIDYVVLFYEYDESNDSIPAYNSNNELINVSKDIDETFRVCVVKYNESLIAINEITNKTYFGEDAPTEIFSFDNFGSYGDFKLFRYVDLHNASYIRDGVYISNDLIGVTTRSGNCSECEENCERDCIEGKDHLHKVKFGSKKAVKQFESFFNLPGLELVITYVIFDLQSGNSTYVAKSLNGHWRTMTVHDGKGSHLPRPNGWSDPLNLELVSWDINRLGDPWSVTFVEEDNLWPGTKLKIPISFNIAGVEAGVELELEFGRNDKHIGTSLIEYCDDICGEGETYKPYTYLNPSVPDDGFWFRQNIQ